MPQVSILSNTQSYNINKMVNGGSLLRVGPIWYGEDNFTTVASISYTTNKQVDVIPILRAEAAAAFSSSRTPIDKIQVELVINYNRFTSHVQRLFALSQVNPVVPVMNPVAAAIMQPIDSNREIYMAYGHNEAEEIDFSSIETSDNPSEAQRIKSRMLALYCSVPIQCRIDNMYIENIQGASRDIRIILTLTRILTANSYGDRVQYVKTLKGAVDQRDFLDNTLKPFGDSNQIKSISKLLGIDYDKMENMLNMLKDSETRFEAGPKKEVKCKSVIDGDTLIIFYNGKEESVRLIGIDTLESTKNTKAFRDLRTYNIDINKAVFLGKKATMFVRSLVKEGDTLNIEFDVTKRDKYKRLLAYVYLSDGRMLNNIIISAGYAYLLAIPPNTKYSDLFRKSYNSAVSKRLGMWRNND